MSKSKQSKVYNLIFLILIALLFIPQTRQPIQVFFNKLIVAVVEPSAINDSERSSISDYNWQLKDISGNVFDFNSAKGKVVVINFWATWCPPCIAEMPSMEVLYQKYKNTDDLVFLFVSNEDREKLSEFMAQKNYTFPVYQPINKYPEAFNVSSIPRTFVISKSGAVVIDKTGPADWSSESVFSTIEDLIKAF